MLQDETEHVGDLAGARGMHDGAADVAALHRDQALGLEDAERLAGRRLRRAELGQQVVLLGQQRAVRELTGQDPVAEHVGEHLRHPRLAQLGARATRGPRRGSVHACHPTVVAIIMTMGLRSDLCCHCVPP